MNTPNVHAGRLERRVRRVDNETMPGIHGFCSLFPFGAIRGVPLLRLTALDYRVQIIVSKRMAILTKQVNIRLHIASSY